MSELQKWSKDVKGVRFEAQVVGFGQKAFKLEEMTETEVKFWESKGVDFSPFKNEATKKTAAEIKQERFNARVDLLLGLGFEREENVFKHESGELNAKKVLDAKDEDFEKMLEPFKPTED